MGIIILTTKYWARRSFPFNSNDLLSEKKEPFMANGFKMFSEPIVLREQERRTRQVAVVYFLSSMINVGNLWRLLDARIQTKRVSITSKTFCQSVTTCQFMTALMLQLLESIFRCAISTVCDIFVTSFYNQCYRWKSRKGLTHNAALSSSCANM